MRVATKTDGTLLMSFGYRPRIEHQAFEMMMLMVESTYTGE